ncbi:hypothetical protein CK501_16570 [Halovibrio salipaludis]|uniref:Sulfotransferase family protein n=1 Tax=Halovibrio salipaludis TaxID=2032626 RepID=A0A2A2EQI0_9GAMM|nr:hypothetical protein CK501_16570 [Halovibrio salipaludis]
MQLLVETKKKAFEDLGFPVADQRQAEKLYDSFYFKGEYGPIIEFCKYGQVFQDVPFSCPELFKYLDKYYPGSKFILTIRDDEDQWYKSITRFHAKRYGSHGKTPTAEDLKCARYVRKGFMYNTVKLHGTSDDDPYNEEIMKAHYRKHNSDVYEYFKNRPNDLLVINVSDKNAYQRFINFIGIDSPYTGFPWENRT